MPVTQGSIIGPFFLGRREPGAVRVSGQGWRAQHMPEPGGREPALSGLIRSCRAAMMAFAGKK